MYVKYSKELLEQYVPDVLNFASLARMLGLKPVGSTLTHLKARCKKYEIDTSHFTGPIHSKGLPARNRLPPDTFLVLGSADRGRLGASLLRRGLLAIGRTYKCGVCSNPGEWCGKSLKLQIDHINGEYWDNRPENLRFICPNCHTQTDTWGSKPKH